MGDIQLPSLSLSVCIEMHLLQGGRSWARGGLSWDGTGLRQSFGLGQKQNISSSHDKTSSLCISHPYCSAPPDTGLSPALLFGSDSGITMLSRGTTSTRDNDNTFIRTTAMCDARNVTTHQVSVLMQRLSHQTETVSSIQQDQ